MGDVGRIVAVTGTRREAMTLRGFDLEVLAIGGSAAALEAALGDIGVPLAAIFSFGMAGALSPKLGLGDWVIGTSVGNVTCDPAWTDALAARLPKARLGPIHADGRLIADPTEKSRLFQRTGAIAADMESHLAARVAKQAGVPFAILRCISDEASSALPPAIAVAMKPDGSLALGAILKSVVTNPLQLADLLTTSLRFNRAYLDMQGLNRESPQLFTPPPG